MHLDKQNFYDFIHYIDPCIGIGMAWEYCDSLEKVFLKKKNSFMWYQPAHVLSYKI